MRLSSLTSSLLLLVMVSISDGHTPPATEWSYSGPTGPEHWGNLAEEYRFCRDGKNQSPINITAALPVKQPQLDIRYGTGQQQIFNNGHTIQINTEGNNTLHLDGTTFTLQQFHFHSPSENRIDGQAYPMSLHLVHTDHTGSLAVLTVLFEEGSPNPALNALWPSMPTQPSSPTNVKRPAQLNDLLPANRRYYRFSGSLTTPPCTEGVRWLVFQQPQQASQEQIQQFRKIMGGANNRPLQALNGRIVVN